MQVRFLAGPPTPAHLRISDAKGQLVLTQPVDAVAGENSATLDVSGLEPGVYWLTLTDNQAVMTKRFVVLR